jgi:anti-sigma factor RsiW
VTARCTGEPLSWPRLERLAAGDLRPRDAAAARAHLAACPACQACLARIQADTVDLPRLPVLAPPARPRWWLLGTPMAARAAIALWLAVRAPDSRDRAVATVAIKGGGTLTLSLVRERDGAIAIDPIDVRDDDRWKVRVTCDRPIAVTAAVTVHQPGQPVSSPLPPTAITCGNDVTLRGAFHVTGGAATICVTVDGAAAPACRALATVE